MRDAYQFGGSPACMRLVEIMDENPQERYLNKWVSRLISNLSNDLAAIDQSVLANGLRNRVGALIFQQCLGVFESHQMPTNYRNHAGNVLRFKHREFVCAGRAAKLP